MRLTRRGAAVLGAVLLALALSVSFGARALNAVVLPGAVALVAALVQVRRAETPRVERTVPPSGYPGDTGTVSLSLRADDPYPATVTDSLPSGVDGDAAVDALVGGDGVSYEVTYRRRGEHELGPVTVVATDVLGLAERTLSAPGTDSVLVFPAVDRLTNAARRDLRSLYDADVSARREEFDRLREYVRGDSLRDVHWKSSAKRGDLVVKEFVAESDAASVRVAAGGAYDSADEMAEAAATLAVALVSAGVPVTLSTPDGVVEAAPGDERSLLEHLARVAGGPVPDDAADVVVTADEGATRVRIGDAETTFDRLVAEEGRPGDDRGGRPLDDRDERRPDDRDRGTGAPDGGVTA